MLKIGKQRVKNCAIKKITRVSNKYWMRFAQPISVPAQQVMCVC